MSASLYPIGRDAAGQPRTFRVRRRARQQAAYRRLLTTILGLDVKALTAELRGARQRGRRHLTSGCAAA
jgi:hypothetical protein